MYSTKTAYTTVMRDLLDKVDDVAIFSYYLGDFAIGKLYNSPLRTDDRNPSFAIFKGRNGNLMYKDHGSGESGNALKFIMQYNNIQTREGLEKELLKIVRKTNPTGKPLTQKRETQIEYNTDIGIVRQPFTAIDVKYWKQFGISIDTLKKFNVFSIKYFLCNNTVRAIYNDANPMYAYKVYDKFKIYRPLSSKYTKWRSNLTNWHVQGLQNLPEIGNVLIITKSLKDVMVLYEMGYNAIAASSETTFIPDDILEKLKPFWNHILILYDRDKTGMSQAREYSKKYGFDCFFVNKKFKAKDISDAVKNTSFDEVKLWLNKTLTRYE